jgi:GNAT superfamily N-acetyltransferase
LILGDTLEIRYRQFDREKELDQRFSMFLKCFPETKGTFSSTLEYYKWKYDSPLYSATRFEFGAYVNNSLIGYYAGMEIHYIIKGKKESAALVFDAMIDPVYQGKGILKELISYATDHMRKYGIKFITGYAIRPRSLSGHLKAGFIQVCKLPIYVRFIRTEQLLPHFFRFVAPIFNGVLKITNYCTGLETQKNRLCYDSSTRAYKGELFNKQQTVFWKDWSKDQTVVLDKNPEFYRWRFSAPGTEYYIIEVFHDSRIVGQAMVANCILKERPALSIIDFMTHNNSSKVINSLHKSILKLAYQLNVTYIATITNKTERKNLRLFTNGFLQSPFSFYLIVKLLTKSRAQEFLEKQNAWSIMWVNTDVL